MTARQQWPEEWPSPMTGAGADLLLAAINAGVDIPGLPAAAERLLCAVDQDEPDVRPVPAALVALHQLQLDLAAIGARLGELQLGMDLAHEAGEAFTAAQVAEAQSATDDLSDAVFTYWDTTGAGA